MFRYSKSLDVQWEIKSNESNGGGGQYSCVATNQYGSTKRDVQVDVILDNPSLSVTIPKSEYIIEETQSQIEIPCLLSPETNSKLRVSWFFNGSEIDTNGEIYKVKHSFFASPLNEMYNCFTNQISGKNLIIHNLSKEHSGTYVCLAAAGNVKKTASTQLIVLFAPIIQESEEECICSRNKIDSFEFNFNHFFFVLLQRCLLLMVKN